MTRTVQPIPIPRQAHVRRPRIAVGTDGTVWADAALDWALRYAATQSASVDVFAGQASDDQAITRRLTAYRWLFTTVIVSPDSPVRTLLEAGTDHDTLVLGYRGRRHGPFGLGRSALPVVTGSQCDTSSFAANPVRYKANTGGSPPLFAMSDECHSPSRHPAADRFAAKRAAAPWRPPCAVTSRRPFP